MFDLFKTRVKQFKIVLTYLKLRALYSCVAIKYAFKYAGGAFKNVFNANKIVFDLLKNI